MRPYKFRKTSHFSSTEQSRMTCRLPTHARALRLLATSTATTATTTTRLRTFGAIQSANRPFMGVGVPTASSSAVFDRRAYHSTPVSKAQGSGEQVEGAGLSPDE